MTARRSFPLVVVAIAAFVVCGSGRLAAQQSSLTVLAEEPPEVVLYRLGPVLVDPKLAIPEIGRDSNIFNEDAAPKDDFVIRILPEVDFFTELGMLRIAARSGSMLTYFQHHASERSMAEQVRGRALLRLSRFKPWVGGASVHSYERTAEIDARASRVDREVAAGLDYELSPVATFTVMGNRLGVRFGDRERFQDVVLSESLDRTTTSYGAALRYRVTPFTSVAFRAYTGRDRFEQDFARSARNQGGDVEVTFSPEAVIRGRIGVGFRRQDFDDPAVKTFNGLTAQGSITTLLMWRAMLGVSYQRDTQYSFDRDDGYYVENGGDVTYTQRVGGPIDAQVRVGRRGLTYGATAAPARREVQWAYHGGVGYSLDGGSRFAVTYELAERTGSPLDRTFSRRRVFGSFSFEFWK